MVDEVLHPGKVGVADGRRAVFPPGIVPEPVAAPVAHVEGRVGEDVVGLEVFVQVAMETVGVFVAEIGFDAADGEVHLGQLPRGRVALLTEDADVALGFAAVAIAGGVFFHEPDRLHKHAARTAAGVEHAAFVGGEHFDEQLDDAAGRVELPAFLALGAGELRQEILVHAPEDILRPALLVAKADLRNQVDHFPQLLLVQVGAGVILGEHAFERRVVALDGDHGVIQQLADEWVFGAALQISPARFRRHPEDVQRHVLVPVFRVSAFLG